MDNFCLSGICISLVLICFLPARLLVRINTVRIENITFNFSLDLAMGFMGLNLLISPSREAIGIRLFGLPLFSLPIRISGRISPSLKFPAAHMKRGGEALKYLWQLRDRIQRESYFLKQNFFSESLVGRLHFGFEDPATTGEIYGYFCALFVCASEKVRIHAKANFTEPCFEAALRGKALFIPIFLLISLGIALLRVCWNDQKRFIFKARSLS